MQPYQIPATPGAPQQFPGAPQQFPGMPQAQPGAPQQPQIWTPAATLSPQMPVQAVKPVATQEDPSKGLRVLIGPVVLSYPHLHEPAAAPGTQNKPKYSCDLYVYKSNPKYAEITQKVQEVIGRVSQAVWRVNWPNGKNPPIMPLSSVRNGAFVAETGNDGWFLRTKSDSRPKCYVGQNRIEANADDMYAGAIVYVSVTALPYDNQTGGKGIYWALNGVLKVADSVRLGGSGTGVEDFQNIPASEFNLATPEQYLDAQVFAGQSMPVF